MPMCLTLTAVRDSERAVAIDAEPGHQLPGDGIGTAAGLTRKDQCDHRTASACA